MSSMIVIPQFQPSSFTTFYSLDQTPLPIKSSQSQICPCQIHCMGSWAINLFLWSIWIHVKVSMDKASENRRLVLQSANLPEIVHSQQVGLQAGNSSRSVAIRDQPPYWGMSPLETLAEVSRDYMELVLLHSSGGDQSQSIMKGEE